MKTFEYKVVYVPDSRDNDEQEVLNSYGIDRWELVSVIRSESSMDGVNTYYFKREAEQPGIINA